MKFGLTAPYLTGPIEEGDYAIRITDFVENEQSVTLRLESRRHTKENVNVANDPAYAKTVAEMKAMLAARLKEAADAKGLGKPVKIQKPKKKK